MNRLAVILVVIMLGGCSAFKSYESVVSGPRAKVTVTKNNPAAELDVVIFEPDEQCDLHFMGRVMLKKEELTRTVVMPAKRAYFRVSGRQLGYHAPNLQDISFVLEENQEYSIEFEWKGSTTTLLGGTTGQFEIKYLRNSSGTPSRPVDVDHFSICKREKQISKG